MSTRTLALASTLAASLLLPAASASADTCDPSRLLIILDQSSSMNNHIDPDDDTTPSLWSIAVNAMDTLTSSFQTKLQTGLMKFPEPNQCNPGSVFVSPALNTKSAIMANLTTAPPTAGNYTPMYQTLAAAADVPELQLSDVPNYVVLITDGWQWCSSSDDPADRFKPIDKVANLRAMGVTTYVVGFGGSVDVKTLNGMAVEGGTALPGCDPTSDETSGNNCYYQASDPSDLTDALNEIATNATTEICDGLDNDCDGEVDENLTQACSSDCGAGTETCDNGQWVGCDAPLPEPEVCDGEDNDCDGTADPGCDCTPNETRDCGQDSDVGVCQHGTQTCSPDGHWGNCEGSVSPGTEMCNGADDDCDGLTDEFVSDSEVSYSLCGPGYECNNGSCEPVDPTVPPDEGPGDESSIPSIDDQGTASGCACNAADTGVGGLAMAGLCFLGVMIVIRRRRRVC